MTFFDEEALDAIKGKTLTLVRHKIQTGDVRELEFAVNVDEATLLVSAGGGCSEYDSYMYVELG